MTREEAKRALDKVINKARVHFYKPIQIAEILYRDRIGTDNIDLLDKETYRSPSKHWRDVVSDELIGSHSTSSSIYQDNLFDDNAIPPVVLNALGEENRKTNGAVEAYIYRMFFSKHDQLANALKYCQESTKADFEVKSLLDSFWNEPGLRRSIDKVYEIIVYSLFYTLLDAMELKVEVSINQNKLDILKEFEDFTKNVICIDFSNPTHVQDARVYRVGVANAADRGLDMYSNWGPAIQIKHLTLDTSLAFEIVDKVASDRIVIVCKDAEKDIIISLLTQIGWKAKIQSVITESDLIRWYELALRGTFSDVLGDTVMSLLVEQMLEEFPSLEQRETILTPRHYENITDNFWV